MKLWSQSCCALIAVACGAAQSEPVSLFEPGELNAAREHAPDLVAAAEAAEEDAQRAHLANDDSASRDYATRARLLLEAAVVESQRIEENQERLQLEEQADAATHELVALQEERAALSQQLARERAAGLARQQASLAFERAVDDEPRRHRARSTELSSARREAARALAHRSMLVVAAAGAMGADADRVRPIAEAAQEVLSINAPDAAIRRAAQVHRQALQLLGAARARHAVDAAAVAAFVAAGRERGFNVEVRPEGLVWTQLPRPSRARAQAWAELVAAHPHGPVQVRGPARQTAGLVAAFRAVASDERVQAVPAATLEVIFPAYGRSAVP